jgi:2',3'-cyclic-nucleotide 2'-phosphodiesterase (5'-nucleotidase family)
MTNTLEISGARFTRLGWLVGAALLVLLVGCTAAAPAPAPLDLTVLHTNDTWGYLDPCG